MSNHRAVRLLLKNLSGQDSIVTVPRLFIQLMCGSLAGGVFLNQLIFWSDKGKEGWFYKSFEEWEAESFLSRYEVNKYAEMLQKLGMLETEIRRNGRSNYRYYNPNIDKICAVVVLYLETGDDIKELAAEDFRCKNLHVNKNFTCKNLQVNSLSPVKIYTSRSIPYDYLTYDSTMNTENGDEEPITEPTDENIVEWFAQRATKEDPHLNLPRTADEIKDGARRAVTDWASRQEKGDFKPSIENYLVTVPENVRDIARAFCYFRGRAPLLPGEDKTWRRDWNDQALLGLTSDLIESALAYMRENQLSIRAPASATTVAENIKTGQLRVDKSGETTENSSQVRQVSFGDAADDVDPMADLMKDTGDK